MKIRSVDTIYRVCTVKPVLPDLRPANINENPPRKRRRFLGIWFLAGIIIASSVFYYLFHEGMLGEKFALARMFLGLNGKYLILFQNNTELRPGGGFIGSFAEVDFKKGAIQNYAFETNIYKRDKTFSKENCLPLPTPFQKIWPEGCYALKDANWSPDFKKSASEVEWFYTQEGGGNVDGVIALDTDLFIDILKLVGPIDMPKYGLTLTSDNFVKETQFYVEKAYFEDPENKQINEPKTILKDMMPEVIERLRNPKLLLSFISILDKNLDEKHFLLNFKNPELKKIAVRNNWTGEIKQEGEDYLYINNANLGGGKSSASVTQAINLTSTIQDDGSIIDHLLITRVHKGTYTWPDGINQNYTRVLVPKGSILKNKQGVEDIDVQEESGKTVFGFWTTVAPGETKTFEISYLLPFTEKSNHNLLIQKQPGILSDQFNFVFDGESKWKWEGEIKTDKLISINLTKK